MSILIAYATNSGNTLYVAERIAAVLQARAHQVTLASIGDLTPDGLSGFDCIVLGSCTWEKRFPTGGREEGHLQSQMEAFLEGLKGKKFSGQRFAVVGLGDSEFTYFCRAADYLEQFVKDAGGTQVVESLRVDSFPQAHDADIDAWAEKLGRAIG